MGIVENTSIKFCNISVPGNHADFNQRLADIKNAAASDKCVAHLLVLEGLHSFCLVPIHLVQAALSSIKGIFTCNCREDIPRAWEHLKASAAFTLITFIAFGSAFISICVSVADSIEIEEPPQDNGITGDEKQGGAGQEDARTGEHKKPQSVVPQEEDDLESSFMLVEEANEEDPYKQPPPLLSAAGVMDVAYAGVTIAAGLAMQGGIVAVNTAARVNDEAFKEHNDPLKIVKYKMVMQHYCDRLGGKEAIDQEIVDLEAFKKLPLIAAYINLLKLLKGDGVANARIQYQNFVRALDKLIESLEYGIIDSKSLLEAQRVQKKVRRICLIRWSDTWVAEYFKEIVTHTRAACQGPTTVGDMTADTFATYLVQANRDIKNADRAVKTSLSADALGRASGALGFEYYTANKNTPNNYHIQRWVSKNNQVRDIAFVRHACPTRPGGVTGTLYAIGSRVMSAAADLVSLTSVEAVPTGEHICPNFHEFLRALDANNLSYFGASLQRNYQEVQENERDRVQEILKLQEQHPNCHIVVQSMEDPFFLRSETDYQSITTYANFKEALIKQFSATDDQGRLVLPLLIRNKEEHMEAYKLEMAKIFDLVHNHFFSGKRDIHEGEWQVFLMLFYTVQRAHLKFYLSTLDTHPVGVYATFCKDCLDRGGLWALVEDAMHAIFNEQFGQKEWMEQEVDNILGPPIAVKKSHMATEKLKIFEDVYPHLLSMHKDGGRKAAFKEAFQVITGGWMIQGTEILPHSSNQA